MLEVAQLVRSFVPDRLIHRSGSGDAHSVWAMLFFWITDAIVKAKV